MTTLPRAIRELRGVHRTQEQFCAEVGVTRVALAKWETGAATPSTQNLQSLVRLGLSDEFLLGSVPAPDAASGSIFRSEAV